MDSKLKQARIDLGYTIEEISDCLKIRKKYLLALEEDRHDLLPGDVYVVGYLKSYKKFLNIESETIDVVNMHNKVNIPSTQDKNSRMQQYMIVISILIIAVIITYYTVFYMENY